MPDKNSQEFPPVYKEIREKIVAHLDKSDPQNAYSLISNILFNRGDFNHTNVFMDILHFFERVSRELIGDPLGDLVKAVIENPNDVDKLYDLAYELYEQGDKGIAATFLKRANKILPNSEKIVSELVVTLEILMVNHEACEILSESQELLKTSDFCRYLLAYNKIMTGDMEESLKIIPTLKDSTDKDMPFMINTLQGMIDRHSALKDSRALDFKDLRGWHMVLNGSVLLHLSPYGLEDAMLGRYAYISDSYALCLHGIQRLKKVLNVAEIDVETILALPDRSSQILAMAVSQIFNKPLEDWNDIDVNKRGLIVAYDLDEIRSDDIIKDISIHRPGQILWAHASYWVNPFPFAPDITTYLYQQNVDPWSGGGLVYNQKLKRVKTSESDKTDEEEISLRIVNAEMDEDYIDDLDDLLSIIEPLKTLDEESKPGIFRVKGTRIRQKIGGPVGSNRFF